MEPRDDRGAARRPAAGRRRLAEVPARRVVAALCASSSLLAAGVAGTTGVAIAGGAGATTGTRAAHVAHVARAPVAVGASPATGRGRAIGPAPAFVAHVVVSLDLGTPAAGVRVVTSWLESRRLRPVVRGGAAHCWLPRFAGAAPLPGGQSRCGEALKLPLRPRRAPRRTISACGAHGHGSGVCGAKSPGRGLSWFSFRFSRVPRRCWRRLLPRVCRKCATRPSA